MLQGHFKDEPILLARREDAYFAIGATCTHYSGPLADGIMVGDTVREPTQWISDPPRSEIHLAESREISSLGLDLDCSLSHVGGAFALPLIAIDNRAWLNSRGS
jgi:hypothetical protein